MKKKCKSKLLDVIRNMPPLYHSFPNKIFDVFDSEIIKWLLSKQDILQLVWNNAMYFKFIVYNPDTGKSQGVDYEN